MTASTDVMYRLLVQGVTDYAIFMLDPDGIVANWNAGAERTKGYTGDEIVGRHFACLYTPEDRAAGLPEAGLHEARETGRFETEGWRLRRDGTRFWAFVVIDAIRDEDGRLLGFAKITRDRTDKRAQELQLLEAKEVAERHRDHLAATTAFLDSVVATIPSSVVVQDAATGLIRLANRQAELLLCGCTGELVGRPAEAVLPATLAALLKTALAAAGSRPPPPSPSRRRSRPPGARARSGCAPWRSPGPASSRSTACSSPRTSARRMPRACGSTISPITTR